MIQPKVSIIVPVYNTELELRRCLDSIIAQTFNDFEVICINDGSTDMSLSILNDFANIDSRIKVINQENKGLSVSRNIGISIAKSEYIMFVDSDDTIDIKMVQILYQKIKLDKADLVISGYNYLASNGVFIKSSPPINTNYSKWDLFKKILSFEITPSSCVCIYKKTLFTSNKLSFTPGIFYEDLDLQYKLIFYSKSISIINCYLYNYYQRKSSTTNNIKEKNIQDIFKVLIRTRDFLHNKNIYNKHKVQLLNKTYNSCVVILQSIHRNKLHIKNKSALLSSFWLTVNTIDEFNALTQSKKIHLAYISITILTEEVSAVYTLFDLPRNLIQTISKYAQSSQGLMQAAIDHLESATEIKSLYVYGAGQILYSLIDTLSNLNIKILGVIDQNEQTISYKGQTLQSQSLQNTPLKNGDTILITSISFVDEIKHNIFTLSEKKNWKINTIGWDNDLK